ncbi:MAG: histone deacetylase family protein [Anaerolineaceae bacterium]|nr:MAG: histone deacetylase family protein [Anaerolineaceae bacterium]
MKKPILTFDNHHHEAHAPTIEQLHGRTVPYFESPSRIDAIRAALQADGLIDLQPTQAEISVDELARTHTRAMIAHMRYLSEKAPELIRQDFASYGLEHLLMGDEYYYEQIFPTRVMRGYSINENRRGFHIFDNTSPVGPGTWPAITHSASVAYAGAHALLDGERRAYALCRPPGHHAGRDFAGGYCFFNNAAIAANALRQRGKIAVLDIDYHHGNGTQAIFWDDPGVLFISIHADPGQEYPYYCGWPDETGGVAAEGLNINYPLPFGTDEALYTQTLARALDDISAYNPAALVVSLGFDTLHDDPMAQFELTISSYARLGGMIDALGLPTLYVQEGGYHVDSLGAMAVSFFGGMD